MFGTTVRPQNALVVGYHCFNGQESKHHLNPGGRIMNSLNPARGCT